MTVKILIVDDSKTARLQVSMALARLGYEMFEAENGDDALTKLETIAPVDLIVTDLNMPWKDGLELLAEVRASATLKETPVLMISAESDPAALVKARALGVTGWVVKPFKSATLVTAVQTVLKRNDVASAS